MIGNPYSYLHSAVYRLRDAVKGTGVYRHLARLRNEQFLPPDEIARLQSERLKELLLHARNSSPYYSRLFDAHKIDVSKGFALEDLCRVPLLKRYDLQTNIENILTCEKTGLFYNSSGGSTGNPVNFYQDHNYVTIANAAQMLFMEWMDIRSGDKTAIFWGADRDFKENSMRVRAWHKFDRIRALNSFSMTDDAIREFLSELNRFKPRYIQGYAGSLYLVAQIINKSHPVDFRPHAIRSSAEMLYDFQREEIERAFGTKVYNFYGSREVNNLANECAAHQGLHVFASGRIIEIVDDSGRPVPDGTAGQIAVTDLTNFSFPFIRYVNGDMAVKSLKPCLCGRGYPLLEKIEGRTTDMIIINGQIIHGEYFTHLFYRRPEIRQFQVIQEEPAGLRILLVARGGTAKVDDLVETIKGRLGTDINLTVEFTDNIPTTETGKFRFTISRLKKRPHAEN